jgi:hypothetical protein
MPEGRHGHPRRQPRATEGVYVGYALLRVEWPRIQMVVGLEKYMRASTAHRLLSYLTQAQSGVER